jgi:hypothetical protein
MVTGSSGAARSERLRSATPRCARLRRLRRAPRALFSELRSPPSPVGRISVVRRIALPLQPAHLPANTGQVRVGVRIGRVHEEATHRSGPREGERAVHVETLPCISTNRPVELREILGMHAAQVDGDRVALESSDGPHAQRRGQSIRKKSVGEVVGLPHDPRDQHGDEAEPRDEVRAVAPPVGKLGRRHAYFPNASATRVDCSRLCTRGEPAAMLADGARPA